MWKEFWTLRNTIHIILIMVSVAINKKPAEQLDFSHLKFLGLRCTLSKSGKQSMPGWFSGSWKGQVRSGFWKYFVNYNEFHRVVNIPISPHRHCLTKWNFPDLLAPECPITALVVSPFITYSSPLCVITNWKQNRQEVDQKSMLLLDTQNITIWRKGEENRRKLTN